ncbi:MAG: ATP-dependent Clp protease adapter ClpS [Acidimicrobiales bacterium]
MTEQLMSESPSGVLEREEAIEAVTDPPWTVTVWNDPVNLMTYVTFVLQKVFGYSKEKATRLMLQVHHEGRSVVAHGTKDEAEGYVSKLHSYGLWATIQQDG